MNHPLIALKEWAAAVQALERGDQILIMRKGGIREETKHFSVVSDAFYLYPTYEHQKPHLVKDENRQHLEATVHEWNPEDRQVTISSWAELVRDIEISDPEMLNRLLPFHIWTESFAEERLKWKRKHPLHVMVLRVYKLDQPAVLPVLSDYEGCKSWIELQTDLAPAGRTPVLSDEAFQKILTELDQALAE
ncbi:DUF1802 family protein [Paenibacillus sp. FJAT-26967]|uniref:DUF1802 family protein n=1 Tax=Paenibacillus sp. FJAT-26967 TaxID=1729690 RepID=UPI0008399A62|nr:DUF1802 family protein [Paenibacillus sp. FJAT-26967]